MHSDSYIVLECPLDTDLSLFSSLLHQRGIPHRVAERAGQLVLEVFQPELVEPVRAAFEALARGDYVVEQQPMARGTGRRAGDMSQAWLLVTRLPVTMLLLALSVVGFLFVELDAGGSVWHWLTFQDFHSVMRGNEVVAIEFESAAAALARGEYWRLLTPVFLHFGWMHIVFNGLWTWDLARRIELRVGSWHLFFLTNAIGVGSNLVQYGAKQDVLFGGMSGVIYGFLGYCWIWDKLMPSRAFMLPRGVAGFMVGWLVFCYLGLTKIVGIYVANEAHLSGLILGLVFGLASAGLARLFSRGRSHEF